MLYCVLYLYICLQICNIIIVLDRSTCIKISITRISILFIKLNCLIAEAVASGSGFTGIVTTTDETAIANSEDSNGNCFYKVYFGFQLIKLISTSMTYYTCNYIIACFMSSNKIILI